MTAYVIIDSHIKNLEGMQEYIDKVGATLQPHGGQPIIAGTNIEKIGFFEGPCRENRLFEGPCRENRFSEGPCRKNLLF